jgi:transcription elongation factor GreB
MVVNQSPATHDQAFFAAWVKFETEEGIEQEYRIMGPDEIDSVKNYVSLDSPLAQALLTRKLDDEVEVETPSGVMRQIKTKN